MQKELNPKLWEDKKLKRDVREAIIDVVARIDLNKEIVSEYRTKIDNCFNQIERCMESNKNNYDLIQVMKRTNGIIKQFN